MQIFCDESGGCDRGTLIVASVTIDPIIADRFVKDFKKKRRVIGEIKGSSFNHDDRLYFFEMLDRINDAASVIVGCTKTVDAGAWLIKSRHEKEIYEELIFQSCSTHLKQNAAISTIRPDGGKYAANVMRQMEVNLQSRFTDTFNSGFFVQFSESHKTAGVQIADVISNTAYKEIAGGNFDLAENPYCGNMWKSGRIRFQHVDLGKDRPVWLSAAE
ncbi:hypothetical protein FHS76_000517 [Ochrobactrum daejeonense]|uniref:DUF3800 domain-containing protein n=1 Tax=Brucella daejeonensis TaxID=659015 RepID=A0A7W9AU80_9HYPH|nr:DUF3800 domain-containing protein [Brucella daejeonensis]MBB5700674.1 hypothetical protein [Brucella daejeonensis]